MNCDRIDDDRLDEVVMGRAKDPDLIAHLATCLLCSRRLADHHAFVEDLRHALRDLRTGPVGQ